MQEEAFRFEQLWNDLSPNMRVFDVPEAVKNKLLRYTPNSQPTWNRQVGFDTRSLPTPQPIFPEAQPPSFTSEPERPTPLSEADSDRERAAFEPLANLHASPTCLDFCLKSIPLQPWPHQIKILRRVAEKFPHSFLIADEVELGKTIETGLILRYLLVSQKVKRVLILAPASIQPQWHEELREKFNLHFWSYSKGEFTPAPHSPFTHERQPLTNPWNCHNLILASSHLVRRSDRERELLEAEPWDLVVLDEAHHARRQSPQNRKETPNRLLQLMQQLQEKTRSLLLLSATPMQIDAIEVFDLLHLLGLQGHWAYSDNFCDYFTTLSGEPNRHTLEFWQQMSVDYFQKGGSPCSRLLGYLQKRDRLISYKLRDIWEKGQRMANPRQLAEDAPFIAAWNKAAVHAFFPAAGAYRSARHLNWVR